MSAGGWFAIALLIVVLLFVPSMRRVALMSFVGSVVYQVVRLLFRGGR